MECGQNLGSNVPPPPLPPRVLRDRDSFTRFFLFCVLNNREAVNSLSKSIACRQQRAYHSSKFLSTGTALGKGVYFARDASYSMKYTIQGTGGGRYMYLARVLVGRYCHGDPKLVVPPSRDPSRPEILFDSVVDNTANPGIFVVFSDSQCYPEYLITF